MPSVELAFDDVGHGPAVVLIHGHPFNRSMWREQQQPLADAGFRVVTPDLRGYGASPVESGTVTMAELAGDVDHLLTSLSIDAVAVVGLSMGGLVAMELATTRPQVWALGLVATTAEPVTEGEQQRRRALAAAADERGIGPLLESMEPLFHPGFPEAQIGRMRAMMGASSPVGAAAALRGRAARPDYRPRLRAFPGPSWVCVGSADHWSTAAVADEIVANLAHPELLVIPGVGHLPNIEAPAFFNDALVDFLRRSAPD
jgi:pimeloyl-ACP methyl ester carboxylesterase